MPEKLTEEERCLWIGGRTESVSHFSLSVVRKIRSDTYRMNIGKCISLLLTDPTKQDLSYPPMKEIGPVSETVRLKNPTGKDIVQNSRVYCNTPSSETFRLTLLYS
jgi:hypothetical protein